MKPKSTLRSFLCIASSAVLTISYAHATNLYWDSNTTTAGAGATPTGTWGVDNFWNTDSTGGAGGAFQTATLGTDDLFFSAGTDAVNPYTVGLNSATQNARLVTFEDGTVTLDTGTLSLGNGGGITVTSGTVTGATISSNLTLTGSQTFNVAAGRTLTLDTGTFTRNAGATLNVLSTGTVTTTMTNLAVGSLVNGIIGPWASHGSGASTKYATIDGSNNIVGLTGTAAATAANVTSVAGTFNYDVAAVGTLGAGANINTLRYTGAAGTIAGALTTNGIMNTGGNALAFSGAMTSGTGEMVLHAANGALTFSGGLNNNGNMVTIAGSGNVSFGATANIITGAGGLTMNGTGTLTLNGGGTQASHNFSGPLTLNNGRVLSYFNGGATNGGLGAGNFTINNGLYVEYWNSTFNRTLGSGAGQFQILGGTSGFVQGSAAGLTVTLNNNSATEVVWGSAFFNPTTLSLQDSAPTGSNLTFSNLLDLNGTTRTIYVNNATNASATLSNVIRTSSGTAGLIKTGTGYMALTAANTYNGATTINGGMLDATTFAAINTNSSIGKGSVGGSAADLVINGGTLRHSAANVATTNRLFSIGTSGGTIDSSGSGTNTLSFTGTGAMDFNSQLGTRTLTLGGSNTGNNTMALLIGNDGSANATSLTKTGAGLWILSNASNSYTGPTTITGGTLSVGVAGNLGAASSNLVFNGGTLQITGTTLNDFADLGRTVTFTSGQTVGLDIANAANVFTVDQTLNQGTGGLTKAGAGTLVINSAHTYTGVTTISGGTLRLDDGGAIAGSIINNGVFLVNKTGAVTSGTHFPALIGGTGSIGFGASTTITLTTPNQFQYSALNTTGGGSVILSGVTTPVFGGLSGATGDLATVISSGYSGVTNLTLNTPSGTSFTYGGVIADGAAGMDVIKTGAGTQILTGNNTYTGETYLNGGTLQLGVTTTSGKITGTTGLTFNGGTLQFNGPGSNADIDGIPNGAPITVNSSSTFGVTAANAGGASNNETVGAVTLNAGQMNFNWTNGGSSGTIMTLTSVSRSGSASANFNSGFASNSSRWKVTGAGTTTGGQIIGPWYTTGGNNVNFASTDYAVYSSDFVAQAAIAGSAETTWTTAANAYTNSLAAQTLTATRTITALRNTGATATLTLATGNNLETYGLLNGVATLLTVAPGTGGVLTTPTGGGNLYLTPGAGAITVSAPINNNGGNVTLVKNGSGTLTLTSTTSNFSGGVVLNAGTLAFDSALNIGGTNNTGGSTVPITVNGTSTMTTVSNTAIANLGTGAISISNGSILTLTGTSRGTFTIGGAITGDGGVTLGIGTFWGKAALNSTANTFKGALTVTTGNDDGNSLFSINSIADGAGYGNIILNVSSSEGDIIGLDYGTGGANGAGGGGATSALVLDHRQIIIQGTSTNTFNNSSNQAVTINTDIGFSGTGARSMRFGVNARAGSGVNTFAGKLTDNVGGAFSPTFNGGTWVLTNSNTHTGATTLSAGTLNINSATALGTGTLTIVGNSTFDNTSAGAITLTNNNPLTLSGGSPTFTGTQDLNFGTGTVTISGANRTITVTNSGATLTLGGAVTADNSGNRSLTKDGAGTLALNGAAGTWTGGVAINRGTLKVGNATALGSGPVSFNSSANAGTLQNTTGALINMSGSAVSIGGNAGIVATITGTAGNDWSLGKITNTQAGNAVLTVDTVNATFTSADLSNSATNRTLTVQGTGNSTITGTVANGSTSAASGLTKNGSGTLLLNGTNTYDGATTVSAGKLFVNGDQSGATGAVSVSGLATIGGTGIIGGNTTIANTGKLEFNLSTGPGSHDKLELASAKTLTFSGGSTLTLTSGGGATTGLYTLVTAPGALSITGSAPASVVLPVGWTADPPQIVADGPNTSLQINITSTSGGGSPFETWAGPGVNFGDDANGDGVSNGLAFLLGASGPNISALNKLPTVTQSGGGLVLTFNMLDSASRGTAALSVQHSSDLGIGDPWEAALVPDVDNTVNDVVFDISGSGTLGVVATIPSSKAAAGKLFGRLKAQP